MLDASPFWQNAFLVGVFVALGWCVWSGWRMGVVRAVFSLLGMLVAAAAAIVAATVMGGIGVAISPVYGPIVGLIAGAAAALAGYVLVSFIGGLLFKRTGQQPTATLRFVFGMGGALVGVFVGVSVVWGALLFARGLGGLCEGTVESKSGFYALPLPAPAARALVKLKRSVEAGSTGRFLESVDAISPEYYRVLQKFGRLVADPVAVRRFMGYPGIQDVLADMSFLELANDPGVQEIARSPNPMAVMKNPKLLAAAKDPGLIAKLQKIDIEKALDYALSPPTPAATPEAASHQPHL